VLATIIPDRAAIAEDTPSRTPIMTTLSGPSAALNAASAPGEEDLITPAVVRLCHPGRRRCLALPPTPVVVCACRGPHERNCGHGRLHSIFSPCERR
jgi:hypothetical protein